MKRLKPLKPVPDGTITAAADAASYGALRDVVWSQMM